MPKKTNKISDAKLVEVIGKRLTGVRAGTIAKELGVSEQTIQYYEAKESTKELKSIVLKRMAEALGDALAEHAVAQLNLTQNEEEDGKHFILKLESGEVAAEQ